MNRAWCTSISICCLGGALLLADSADARQVVGDRLGTEWSVTESGIAGRWVRRGSSDTWDANWANGAVAVLSISVTGDQVRISRKDLAGPSTGLTAIYEGTLAPDGTVEGNETYTWNGQFTQKWQGRIVNGVLPPAPGNIDGPAGPKYLGCFADRGDRDVGPEYFSHEKMTTELCLSYCGTRGFKYAATQFGGYCFCGNAFGRFGEANNCDVKCSGNGQQTCGGSWANSVYAVAAGDVPEPPAAGAAPSPGDPGAASPTKSGLPAEPAGKAPAETKGADVAAVEGADRPVAPLPPGAILETPAWVLEPRLSIDFPALAKASFAGVGATLSAGVEVLTGAEPGAVTSLAPLFDYVPPQAAADGPVQAEILGQAAALKGATETALAGVEQAWQEAVFAAQYGNEEATSEALAIVRTHLETAVAAQSSLDALAAAAKSAPPLPDAAAEKTKANDAYRRLLARTRVALSADANAQNDVDEGVWQLTDAWTSKSIDTGNCDAIAGDVRISANSALTAATTGGRCDSANIQFRHTWQVPPKTLRAGQEVIIGLTVEDAGSAWARGTGRGYTAVFLGSYGGASGFPQDVRIPGMMDYACKEADSGPLWDGQALSFQATRGADWSRNLSSKIAVQAAYKGAAYSCRGARETPGTSLKIIVPPPGGQRKFLLIIAVGHGTRVTQRSNGAKDAMGGAENTAGSHGTIYYEYTSGSAEPATTDPAEAPEPPLPNLPPDKTKDLELHETNIRVIKQHLAKDEAELAKETDDRRRKELEWRILQDKSDLAAEQDLIASIEQGAIVHTRSAFDDYAHDRFIETIRETQQDIVAFQRERAAIPRLLALVPADQRPAMQAFVDRQMTPEVLARMDHAKLREIANALSNQVQGYWQGEAARHTEQGEQYNDYLTRAERVKLIADTAVLIGSMGSASAYRLGASYGAAAGLVQGGPVEAVSRAALFYSAPLHAAMEAMKAYPKDGAWGAAKSGAMGYVMARLTQLGSPGAQGGRLTAGEAEGLARFEQAKARGEALARDFEQAHRAMASARTAGQPIAEVRALERALAERAAAVQADLHAKAFLKYRADRPLQQVFIKEVDALHFRVEDRFHRIMADAQWTPQRLRPIRNSTSAGSVNTDFDIALVESPGIAFSQNGQPRSIAQWQHDAQAAWERAFREETGLRAANAMEQVTTLGHAEAYKDLAWLGRNPRATSATWAKQAGDVTRYKAQEILGSGHLELDYYSRLMEAARGTAKDINTKLLNRLRLPEVKIPGPGGSARQQELLAKYREIQSLLQDIGEGRIDPVHGDRMVRNMTGGYGITDVVDHASTLISEFGTLAGKPPVR